MRRSRADIAYDFFKKIKEDLKNKNRYNVDPRLDELIQAYIDESYNHEFLKKGKNIYRARKYDKKDAGNKFINKRLKFQGFNACESGINKKTNEIPDGRCNPKGIAYLYASDTVNGCICEIAPSNKTYISVATIRITKRMKCINLYKKSFWADNSDIIVKGTSNGMLALYLAETFAQPYKEEGDYYLCQYVSEKIKNAGFDGLTFRSSVCDDKNIIIFDEGKIEIPDSRLFYIKSIEYDYIDGKGKS